VSINLDAKGECGKRVSCVTYLADQHVCIIEVATEHLGSVAGIRFDLNANFHAFAGRRNVFVVALDGCHRTELFEL
jgi:hypothetical protein